MSHASRVSRTKKDENNVAKERAQSYVHNSLGDMRSEQCAKVLDTLTWINGPLESALLTKLMG